MYEFVKISHFSQQKERFKMIPGIITWLLQACNCVGTPHVYPCLDIVRSKSTIRCQAAGLVGFIKKTVSVQKQHDYTLVN